MFKTLTDYAKANGLPAPRAGQYRERAIGQGGRNSACVNGALEEAALDSESAYATAPGARQLMVDGDDCDTSDNGAQALFDAMLAPLTGHGSRASAAVESVSYGLSGTERSAPSLLKISHAIALRAAAEGVSLLIASGDVPGNDPPATDPDVTAVGGTTLGIGARNQRLFETGWSTAFGERTGTIGAWHESGILLAAGGGVSAVYSEPGYQKGVVPSSMARTKAGWPGRTVPDISADADPYETDINNKLTPGFLVGVNDARDTSGTHQITAPGYDTMTGLGAPNGSALIKALRSGK